MDDFKFFKEISEAHAPSGREHILSGIVKEAFCKYGNSFSMSKLNNMRIDKKGKYKNSVMLMAHSDEVFLMVEKVMDEGFIQFKAIGIDPKSLVSQEVIVHGTEDICGVVVLKADSCEITCENMYIDTFMNTEKLGFIIKTGDYVTLKRRVSRLLDDNIACKAADNRAGIASLYVCCEELRNVNTDFSVDFVCSCQEEVGYRGAKIASYDIRPDIAVAVDTTFDGGNMGDRLRESQLGGGPVICVGPNIHCNLRKKIMDIADRYSIPYQIEVEPGNTGTDAWDIQTAVGGIPTLLISIPIKYMHTSVEVVNMEDIRNTGRLLASFIKEISPGEMEGLLCF